MFKELLLGLAEGPRPPFHLYQLLPNFQKAQELAPQLVAVAQAEYDKWDESDVDTYGGGGICHLIAEAMVGVLDKAGIEASMVSSHHEQHVYVVCKLAEGVYSLDIPHSLYEIGAMFTWAKIPNVQFTVESLEWVKMNFYPDTYPDYIAN